MAKQTMTASGVKTMTDGQIEDAVNKLRDAMRKHRSEITSEVMQQVLGIDNLGMHLFVPLRQQAEMISNQVVLCVECVNRTQAPRKVFEATRCKLYVNDTVVDTMPRGDGQGARVVFFKVGRFISDSDLEKEYEQRGLVPADPYSLAAVNEGDPSFADEHPNGTHWKDTNGNWCYTAFGRWRGERYVNVDCSDDDWRGVWWFAGLRK